MTFQGTRTLGRLALFRGSGVPPHATAAIDNVDLAGFEQMADAAAHAILTFAETTSAVNGTAKGKAKGQVNWQYKGHQALK